tara:strand:- start:393 stop:821 length:429 start_codon:yes stop_codon:yes gene_type:complete
MLNKLHLRSRIVKSLNYEDYWERSIEDVNEREGFLQVTVSKASKNEKNYIIDKEVITLVLSGVVKALVKNEDSDEVDDALEIMKVDVDFHLIYTYDIDSEVVEQLFVDEAWFFERDSRLFLSEVVNSLLSNTNHNYIKIPLI